MKSQLIISGSLIEYTNYAKDTLLTPRELRRGNRINSQQLFKIKRYDNLARARKVCVRKLFIANSSHSTASFCTFTFTENNSTRSAKVAGTFFSRFLKRLQRKYPNEHAVVAVWERHKSGRVHIHAMLFGGDHTNERESRKLASLWAAGNVDVKSHDKTPRMLHYVAKYITKQEDDFEYYVPSYWSTRNIDQSHLSTDENADYLLSHIGGTTISESSRGSVYFGKIIRIKKLIHA